MESEPLRGMSDSKLGQETYKMNSEHLVVPESKEELKKKKRFTKIYTDGSMSEGHRSQLKELPQ